jgi:anti-sigma factor RsiW
MNPADLPQQLAAYADGELDPATRAEIETLLAQQPEARAAVERWQALRRSARRAVDGESVPAGLETRLRANLRAPQHPRRAPRVYRLGLSGLAVAAALVLAFFVWPAGAAGTSVKACDFARVYRRCAVEHRHDPFAVRGDKPCNRMGKLCGQCSMKCKLPDVAACGRYQLDGGCNCSPCEGLRVVHAYFRANDDPNAVVSVFATDNRIKLCGANGVACPCCVQGEHEYRGGTDGDVSVVGWRDGTHTYVLVGRMTPKELVHLAEGLPAVALPRLDTPPPAP